MVDVVGNWIVVVVVGNCFVVGNGVVVGKWVVIVGNWVVVTVGWDVVESSNFLTMD